MSNRKSWGFVAATDWRVHVKRSNYRVPDVTILPVGSAKDPILNHPPLLVIKILSPEDRLNAMAERCLDYLQFGVANVSIIDPQSREAYFLQAEGLVRAESGELTVAGTPIRVALSGLFAELDAV